MDRLLLAGNASRAQLQHVGRKETWVGVLSSGTRWLEGDHNRQDQGDACSKTKPLPGSSRLPLRSLWRQRHHGDG